MTKKSRTYRLSDLTMRRVADLRQWLPADSDTHVIEEAIAITHTQLKEQQMSGKNIVIMYTDGENPNDTLTVVAEQDLGQGPVPVDQVNIYREGDRYSVRGQWVSYDEAVAYARQQLDV